MQVAPFERFDLGRGITDRDAIAPPGAGTRAGANGNRRTRRHAQSAEHGGGIRVAQMGTGIGQTHLPPARPAPARAVRLDRGQHRRVLHLRSIRQEQAVAGKPARPVVPFAVDRATKPRRRAGGVDEQIGGECFSAGRANLGQEAVFARHVRDLPCDFTDADVQAEGADHRAVAPDVERQAIFVAGEDRIRRRRHEASGPRQLCGGGEGVERGDRPGLCGADPMEVKARRPDRMAIGAIGVDIIGQSLDPAGEARAQTIARTRTGDPVIRADTQIGLKSEQRGQGAGNPIGQRVRRDRRRQQRDVEERRAPLQRDGGVPAGQPATRDQHPADRFVRAHADASIGQ